MVNILSQLKKFDAHYKIADNVNEKTVIGAILSIISIILVLILIISEFRYYYQVNIQSLMITDSQAIHEPTLLDFKINFDQLKCSHINFIQDTTRGTLHTNQAEYFDKQDIANGEGCAVKGIIATDKIGGNFKIEYKNDEVTKLREEKNVPQELIKENLHKYLEEINISHVIEYFFFHATDDKGQSDTKNIFQNKVQKFPKGDGKSNF